MVYRVGNWLRNKHDNDLWEIIKILKLNDQYYVQIDKQTISTDLVSKRHYASYIRHITDIEQDYELAHMAQVLYSTKE